MSRLDPASNSPASLAALRAAFVAAQSAPAPDPSTVADEQENSDISTPRARAAAALEVTLKARRDYYRAREEYAGEDLCKSLIEMCAWHEHPVLRNKILALQSHGLALMEAMPAGQPSAGAVGNVQDEYMLIKPREDDAAAIAAALGLTPEEARAYGLVGTLAQIGVDDSEPVSRFGSEGTVDLPPPVEESLEDVFRREALILVTRTLPQALQQFWRAQQSLDALLTVRRGFHTLKGDARVTAQTLSPEHSGELTGLATLSEAAEDVIDMLLGEDHDTLLSAPALPAGAFSLLQEVADALVQRLQMRVPLPNEGSLLQRLYAMQRKAAALSGTSFPETPVLPQKAPATVRLAPRATPHPLLPTFLDESDRLMADLHRALATLSENPSDESALVRARVKLHTLKGGAALVGSEAEDIQLLAHSAEDLLELIEDYQLSGEMTQVPQAVLEGVLDAEEALQTLLDILKMQSRSGRLSSIQQLVTPPAELATVLNALAARVRSGAIIEQPEIAQAPQRVRGSSSSRNDASSLLRRASIASVGPITGPRRGLGTGMLSTAARGTGQLDPSRVSALVGAAALPLATTSTPGLAGVLFADMLDRGPRRDSLGAQAVNVRARAVEDHALDSAVPFRLYTCVQYLSNYVQEIDRYRVLVRAKGHLYVFGKPDAAPPPVEGVTIVPLAVTDPLSTERVVILDSDHTPTAFFAHPDAGGQPSLEPQYTTTLVEDPATVRDAVRRVRLAIQQDAGLIETRRAALSHAPRPVATQRSSPSPALIPQSPSESGPESGVKAALDLLEDLSVKRDALQELIAKMSHESGESRRSTRRLRTLIERVSSELADLRSELARTTGQSGDWDLLEKEEYTAVDVLLMQLDEALADLEESDNNLRRDIGEAHAHMESQVAGQLRAQRALLNVSMVPLSQIEDRLAYAVRTQSRRLNKQVNFTLEGGDLLLDGRIAESLFEPLMHLINNAMDHGIEETVEDRRTAGKPEEGLLTVRGRAAGDGVLIELSDDGRGIDPTALAAVAVKRGILSEDEAAAMSVDDRLALIWRPGFSTSRTVSTVSGRGIGMKSVRDDISNLQGQVTVRSEVGAGTTFSLRLPRSLAMMRVEVVREGRDLVAIPITQLIATYPAPYSLLEQQSGAGIAQFQADDRMLQVYQAQLASGISKDGDGGYGTLLEIADRPGGLLVDEVLGSQYMPVRSVPAYLHQSCALLGYAVGGGGRILPIIDVPMLLDSALRAALPVVPKHEDRAAPTVLVVDDSPTMRRALGDTLRRAGFEVHAATDGRDALNACTLLMPDLITLDMEMPGMDGLEALSALRVLPNGADVPVFMITSRQQARHRAAALAAGVTRYFTKPYDGDALIEAAQEVLAEVAMQPRGSAAS